MHIKKNDLIIAAIICGLFSMRPISAAGQVVGTEDPASYGQDKERIMAREERRRRSQTIQDVAQTYREMVSAYKANRILRAEEMSQRLDDLLDDPVLPVAFSDRMRKKQEIFLQRVYSDEGRIRMDVPDDDISDTEFIQIQQAVRTQKGADTARSSLRLDETVEPKSLAEESVSLADVKKQRVQERLAVKAEQRERKIALREARREKKIALREQRKAARLAVKAQREDLAAIPVDKDVSRKGSGRKNTDAQEKLNFVEQELAQRQDAVTSREPFRRSQEIQEAAIDLKKEEVDRYVRLYQEDMKRQRQSLQQEFSAKIDSLYQDGVEFYENNAHRFAYDVFSEVEKLRPDYKETRNYLSVLEKHFRLQSLETDRGLIVQDELDSFLRDTRKEN